MCVEKKKKKIKKRKNEKKKTSKTRFWDMGYHIRKFQKTLFFEKIKKNFIFFKILKKN